MQQRDGRSPAPALVLAGVVIVTLAACSGSKPSSTPSTALPTSVSPATIATSTPAAARSCGGGRRSRTVAYAQHPGTPVNRTSLDLYLPAHPDCAPVFAFVHGGGYCCGDKANDIAGPAAWLTRNGWIVASVNYRLTQGTGSVQFPAFIDDVADAIAYLRAHIGEWGGDGTHIVLAGHSTGGDMVALLGSDPVLLADAGLTTSSLRCVVVLDAAALDIDAVMRSGGAISLYQRAFGSDPAVWRDASAVTHAVQRQVVARWLVVLRPGERPLKLQSQQRFVTELRANGATVTTIDARSISHGQVIADIGKMGDSLLTTPTASFLSNCM